MTRIALVTDSTAYLPRALAQEHGVVVVPVDVVIDGVAMPDDEASGDQVATALRGRRRVTTSRATPEAFLQAFDSALAAGAEAVVCATLSGDMSATYESALVAARRCAGRVEVIDSRTIAMALGFAVLAGARAAAERADVDTVAGTVRQRAAGSSVMFYVDTLEFLRRGGRIGSAGAVVGSALHVKPILQVTDGRVSLLERVRTSGRALARMSELAIARATHQGVEIAVQDIGAAARADALADELSQALPGTQVLRGPLGAAVGAHTGPGTVAVVVA